MPSSSALPGRRLCTSMSAVATSASSSAMPVGDLRSIVTDFLLRLNSWEVIESPGRNAVPMRRPSSPPSGRSTLMTSAPRSPNTAPANGPASTWPSSITRIPANGNAVMSRHPKIKRLSAEDAEDAQRARRSKARVARNSLPLRPLRILRVLRAKTFLFGRLFRGGAELGERAGMHELAREGAADDALGGPSGLDQSLEIDAGLDAELMAQEHHVLGAHVAGRRAVLVAAERAAAEPGDRAVEQIDPHLERGIEIRAAEPARVVQMQPDADVRHDLAHRGDPALDRVRIGPADRVGAIESV